MTVAPPPPYTTPTAPSEPTPLSVTSLFLGLWASGLVGVVVPLVSIAAVIFGHKALRSEPTGMASTIAGLVLGYLGVLVSIGIGVLTDTIMSTTFMGTRGGTL